MIRDCVACKRARLQMQIGGNCSCKAHFAVQQQLLQLQLLLRLVVGRLPALCCYPAEPSPAWRRSGSLASSCRVDVDLLDIAMRTATASLLPVVNGLHQCTGVCKQIM